MEKSQFIPPKNKPKAVKAVQDSPPIPQDLQDQWKACETCAMAYHVFQEGSFRPRFQKAVDDILKFLKELHTSQVRATAKHPQADLIPELKDFNKALAKAEKEQAKQDGKNQ